MTQWHKWRRAKHPPREALCTLIDLRFRDCHEVFATDASLWNWGRSGNKYDIIAWREHDTTNDTLPR